MNRSPEIAKYMKTARSGTWEKLTETAKTLTKIYLTYYGVSYSCDFSTATNGSFFLVAEGLTDYELVLATDTAIANLGTTFFEGMTLTAMLNYLADYADTGKLSGWREFCEWFDTVWSQYDSYTDDITVMLGPYLVSPPDYFNPTHQVSTFLHWLASVAESDPSCANSQMREWPSEGIGYTAPLNVSYSDGQDNISATIQITFAL